tara:strand:+ start:1128 stop:2876 length:1749 start_codon:yes stop_codon:yes gene_type:complete
VAKGYPLPLRNSPGQQRERKQLSFTRKEIDVIDEQIAENIRHGAIEETKEEHRQLVSRVVLNKLKNRMCVDFEVNNFLEPRTFKDKTKKDFRMMLQQGDYMAKTDIKKAFWTIPIQARHRKYLKFRWRGKLYQYRVVPFGLSCASHALRLLTLPLIRKARKRGIRIVMYADDILVMHQDKKKAEEQLRWIMKQFMEVGYIMNEEKTTKVPDTRMEFLGLTYDSRTMTMSTPASKVRDIRKMARRIIKDPEGIRLRPLQSLVGKINFVRETQIHGRERFARLLHTIRTLTNRSPSELGEKKVMKDLRWWAREFTTTATGATIQGRQGEKQEWTTDAGPHGYACQSNQVTIVGAWSAYQRRQSTNYREMRALLSAMKRATPGVPMNWRTDSRVAASYITKGYGKANKLNSLARKILIRAARRRIEITPIIISQQEIEEVDRLSRIRDATDYYITQKEFHRTTQELNVYPEVDLMATRFTKKCQQFYAMGDPTAAAQDAFTQHWGSRAVYAFPPQGIINKTITKLQQDQAWGIIILPDWQGAAFTTMIRAASTRNVAVMARTLEETELMRRHRAYAFSFNREKSL